jgi:uncharacterized membrane protein YhfC
MAPGMPWKLMVGSRSCILFPIICLRGQDLSGIIPEDQLDIAQAQVAAYWSVAWYDSFLSTLERFLTIPIQICLSIVVLQVFTRGRAYWLLIAILWHAFTDALAVFAAGTWGVYVTEAIIALLAVISVLIIFRLRQPEPEPIGTDHSLQP